MVKGQDVAHFLFNIGKPPTDLVIFEWGVMSCVNSLTEKMEMVICQFIATLKFKHNKKY